MQVTGGAWKMSLHVHKGWFRFGRKRYKGSILPKGILTANGDDTFNVGALLAINGGGFTTLGAALDHNVFPPTIQGGLAGGAP